MAIPSQLVIRGVTTMDNFILTKYVAGFVMGDGFLSRTVNSNKYGKTAGQESAKRNSKYSLKQLSIHRDYVEWQRDILSNITSTTIDFVDSYRDNRGFICNAQCVLNTRVHPLFTEMRHRLYSNGRKVIDPHYLKMLDWESFATMYMDNGWIENKQTETKGIWTRVSIATMAYSYADNKMLRDYMAEKYNLHFDVDHKKSRSGEMHFYLRNTKERALYFLDNISRYVLPSFEYKLSSLNIFSFIPF